MGGDQGYAGVRVVSIDAPDELAAIDSLRSRLALVPGAIARWDRVARIRPRAGSQIAMDDEASGWRQLSHGISYQLNHAADTLNALTVLIPPDGPLTLPYVAHFSVVRSALEAASLALWIVAPEDPRVRLERHLRNAWREVSADAELSAVVMNAVAGDASLGLTAKLDRGRKDARAKKKKHVDQIRASARRVGVEDPTQSSRTVGFAEIVRESTAAVGLRGVFGEVVWREISGLTHPSMMRSITAMDRQELVDHGDGTIGAMFTGNAGKAKYSVEAAYLAFSRATELFGERKIRPGDSNDYSGPDK